MSRAVKYASDPRPPEKDDNLRERLQQAVEASSSALRPTGWDEIFQAAKRVVSDKLHRKAKGAAS